jgi:hypothetical protein
MKAEPESLRLTATPSFPDDKVFCSDILPGTGRAATGECRSRRLRQPWIMLATAFGDLSPIDGSGTLAGYQHVCDLLLAPLPEPRPACVEAED